MNKLILIRHGESEWNKQNIFTGWTDVDLTEKGEEESREAGRLLKDAGISPDIAFTSVLKRAIRTLFIVLEKIEAETTPVFYSWRLNERHYGALQGLNKSETANKYGEEQVKIWRRSYEVKPPMLVAGEERDAIHDPKYGQLKREDIPLGESLEDATKRLMPYWDEAIFPKIKEGKNVLVVAHGTSIRGIVKHLENLNTGQVVDLDIPTGIPLVYEFDEKGNQIKHYYLGDQNEIEKKIEEVKNQAKIK